MAGRVFGGGVHGHVDAVLERLEVERRRPGIVHDDDGAAGMRRLGDRRNVLHLVGVRARRFREHQFGVGLHQARYAGADLGVVILDLDAHPLEHGVGEFARRVIDGIDDQRVVAGRQIGDQRQHHGGQAGGHDRRAGGPLELVDRRGQRVGGGRASRAIGVFLFAVGHRARIGKQHRRGMHDRRIDKAEIGVWIVAGMGEAGIDAGRLHRFVICHGNPACR